MVFQQVTEKTTDMSLEEADLMPWRIQAEFEEEMKTQEKDS